MNRSITSNKIESVILKLSTNKSSGPDSFTDEFYQTFKEELLPILLKIFQNTVEEGMLPKSFSEVAHPDTRKRQKHHKKRKYRPISLMNIDTKILNKF